MARARKSGGDRDNEPLRAYRSSTPLLERESARPDALAGDEEIGEFVEFFTQTRPDLIAIYLTPPPVGPYTPPIADQAFEDAATPIDLMALDPEYGAPAPPRSHLARATERVRDFLLIQPTVSLNWPHIFASGADSLKKAGSQLPLRLKAPPLWVIAQVAILAALLVAIVPQIMSRPSPTGCAWYTTQSGDTLGELSGLFGVSAKTLAATNHLSNGAKLPVNQKLCIPAPPGQPLTTQVGLVSVDVNTLAPSQVLNASSKVRQFIAFALPYAREASQKTGWPVSMILGQWGLEKSWRTYTFTGYNWGNCGAIPGFPAIPGTSVPGSPDQFAFANTPEQGVAEYVHVAHLRYYTAIAPAWHSGGANAAARALGASPWDWGHYTAIGSPGSSVIGLMQRYNLYWYDSH